MRVEWEGEGPALFLLHGLGGPLIWQRVSPLLAAKFRSVTIHLPGFGESEGPVEPISTDGAAACVSAVAHQLGIGAYALCGTSWGGEVAARCVTAAPPGRIERLVLVNSIGFDRASGRVVPPVLDWIVRSAFFGAAGAFVLRSERVACLAGRRSFYAADARPPGYCRDVHAQIMYERHRAAIFGALRSMARERSRAASIVASSGIPSLIVAAGHDRILSHAAVEGCLAHAPNARLRILADCGHSLPLEKPEELAEIIAGFAA